MFEAEIMITGYTVLVVATSVSISKYISRKQLSRTNKEMVALKTALLHVETTIKKLGSE